MIVLFYCSKKFLQLVFTNLNNIFQAMLQSPNWLIPINSYYYTSLDAIVYSDPMILDLLGFL